MPDWLAALPSEQALIDATRVVFDIQRQAGIDLPTDGELYRFDVNHPDTNGMIDYFVTRLGGISARGRPAGNGGVPRQVRDALPQQAGGRRGRRPIGEGTLNLPEDCARAAAVAGGPFKFTLTSPYMLARTLLDTTTAIVRALTLAIADVLAAQARDLACDCVQVDEANIPGNPADAPLAAAAINRVLDAVRGTKAVHFCFGNYGGQTIQAGTWQALIAFLNELHADHLVLELAHRPPSDLEALADLRPDIGVGIGVVDIKVNHVETRRRNRRGDRPRRTRARSRPRPLRAPGLRLLDAQAIGGRSQDRRARQGPGSLPRPVTS